MVAGTVDVENVTRGLTKVIADVGSVALWLQTLGVILILWIIFESFTLWFNRRRMKEVSIIRADMSRIERKIDSIARATKEKK